MRDLHLAIDRAHLVDGLDLRGEPPVDAQDGAVDESAQRQIVEGVVEIFPWCDTSVFLDNLLVETVDSCYLTRLVITSEEDY